MRFLIAGVSALALMTAAGCKEKAAEDTTSVAGAAGKSEEIVSSDMMAKFKAKDYGETDTVLGAMSEVWDTYCRCPKVVFRSCPDLCDAATSKSSCFCIITHGLWESTVVDVPSHRGVRRKGTAVMRKIGLEIQTFPFT